MKETSASFKGINESQQCELMYCAVCDDGGHTPSTLRGAVRCNALASVQGLMPALLCLLPAKQDHNMGLSLPQQQALHYYSLTWLTPGLPAVHRHRKSHFGAVGFFVTDLRPAELSLSIKDLTLQDTMGKLACYYNDNISVVVQRDCLFTHWAYKANTSHSLIPIRVSPSSSF